MKILNKLRRNTPAVRGGRYVADFTALNIRYTLRRSSGLAYRKTQSAYGLCAFFFRHIFAVAGNLRFPLSQPQKRRIAFTLGAIFLKFFEKGLTKIKVLLILNHKENILIKHFSYNAKETLAYNDFGNEKGFPILVQHGTMASIKDIGYFDELQKVARVICIARPGYGESSPYLLKDILEYGTIVSKLVETLSIKQFDIFSSSAGAPYGYAIAKECQNKARNIYVYSGTPALYDENIQKKWPFPVNKDIPVDISQQVAREVFFSNIPAPELEKDYIKDSMANNCFGEGQNIRLRFKDWGFNLSEVKAKVYMQHSKKDNVLSYNLAEMTKELLPNCELELLEEGEHFSDGGYKLFIKNTILRNLV